MVAFGKCNGSIHDILVNLLGRQLLGEKSIVLFEFFLDLSLFRYFIPVLLDPLCDFSGATDSLVRHHLNGEFNDFDTGLLDDKKNFGFVFRS